MSQLIILVGGIACGKTTFARGLIAYNPEIIHLSSDAFRAVIGFGEWDQTVSGAVFNLLEANTTYFLRQGKTVILDATNKRVRDRRRFVERAREEGAKIICYYFNASLDLCLSRNATRDRIVPEDIVIRFYGAIEKPTLEEADEIFELDKNGVIVDNLDYA